MGFRERRRARQGERGAESRWEGWEQAHARSGIGLRQGDVISGEIAKGAHYRIGTERGTRHRGAAPQRLMDGSRGTICVNPNVAFVGSWPREWGLSKRLGQHDEETACIRLSKHHRVPGLRYQLAYEKATRFTVDLAVAHSLRRLR